MEESLAARPPAKSGEEIESWEIAELLAALTQKSLVVFEASSGSAGRHRLLESVRQYGRERLSSAGEDVQRLRRLHRDQYLTFAHRAWKQLGGPEQEHWLDLLTEDIDNLRAAFDWCLDEPGERADSDRPAEPAYSSMPLKSGRAAMHMAVALHRLWASRGHFVEGRERYAAALAHPDSRAPSKDRADALNGAGVMAYLQGNYFEARKYFELSLVLKRGLGDDIGIAATLSNLGLVADEQGDWRGAQPYYEESLAIRRRIGDRSGTAVSLLTLAFIHKASGDFAAATRLAEESLDLQRELNDTSNIAIALVNLAPWEVVLGALAAARAHLRECFRLILGLGEVRVAAYALEAYVQLARREGDPVVAVRYSGAAESLRLSAGVPLPPSARPGREEELRELRAEVGGPAFDAAFGEGATLAWQSAVKEALRSLDSE